MLFLSDEVANIRKHNHSDLNFSLNGDKLPHIITFGDQILESERTDYNRIRFSLESDVAFYGLQRFRRDQNR